MAQTNETWTAASGGSWTVAGNWSGDVIPDNGVPTGATYNAIINNGSAVQVGSWWRAAFGGTFSNFASGTLTGGTYNSAGTLQIDQIWISSGSADNRRLHHRRLQGAAPYGCGAVQQKMSSIGPSRWMRLRSRPSRRIPMSPSTRPATYCRASCSA